ncbi:MAG: lysylphosphatidylglycerol synthase transmembrane domain-containing protein [Candidatus Omnitrophota bacterium]|nr:lysylphosphatidylglycerol synthase transmembrane domain-containing protein [Candidatus Omnitrophota bacterium]
MGNLKKILVIILRVGISLTLLVFLFRQVDRKSLFEIIKKTDKFILFTGFFTFFSGYVFALLRWEMLLRALNFSLSLKRVVISFSSGIFFNLFLPSTIGGDLMRSLDLAAHTKRPKEVVATVLLDRLSGYTGMVLLALISLGIGYKFVWEKSIILPVAIITTLLIIILFFLFNKHAYIGVSRLIHSPMAGGLNRLKNQIRNFHKELHYFKRHKGVILNNVLFSVLIQAITPLAFFLIALSMGIRLNAIYFFVFLPIITAISLLPVSIGGLGLRDAATIYFFAKAGLGKDTAFAMSLINFFFILAVGALGGLVYVLAIYYRRLQHHTSSAIHKT